MLVAANGWQWILLILKKGWQWWINHGEWPWNIWCTVETSWCWNLWGSFGVCIHGRCDPIAWLLSKLGGSGFVFDTSEVLSNSLWGIFMVPWCPNIWPVIADVSLPSVTCNTRWDCNSTQPLRCYHLQHLSHCCCIFLVVIAIVVLLMGLLLSLLISVLIHRCHSTSIINNP